MKWNDQISLPCEAEMVAGPLTLRVWKGDVVWVWEVFDGPDSMVATGITLQRHQHADRAGPQARCLAVANGILLQRVREAWGDDHALLDVAENDDLQWSWSVWTARCEALRDCHHPSETEALIAALKAAP
jgi:hypothetical protein